MIRVAFFLVFFFFVFSSASKNERSERREGMLDAYAIEKKRYEDE